MTRRNTVIYVDVDETLVRSHGGKVIPITNVVEGVRKLKSRGAVMFLWSSGGADYAQEIARNLGLADCFAAYLPKPSIYVDDQSVGEWRYCVHVHPGQIDSIGVE